VLPCLQGDMFGSTFSLQTAGVADLPKDMLIPGKPPLSPPTPPSINTLPFLPSLREYSS
jgi:hypothetical protein